MAFVNETLTEQDKEWFASFQLESVFRKGELFEAPNRWTVDRDRDAFLVSLEGQGADGYDVPPQFLALFWQGLVIRIEAYTKGTGSYQAGTEKWWRVTQVLIPKILQDQGDEVLHLIRGALDARGTNFRRDVVKAVHIELPNPRFVWIGV
jgi:hypothetical protein